MDDIEKLAKSLTTGDCIRICNAEPDGTADRRRFSKEALFRLVQIGLADAVERDNQREVIMAKLTPIGLAVRDYLMEQEQ